MFHAKRVRPASAQLEAQITELQAALVDMDVARTAGELPAAEAEAAVARLSAPLPPPEVSSSDEEAAPEVRTGARVLKDFKAVTQCSITAELAALQGF